MANLTVKELNALEDELGAEALAIYKNEQYAKEVSDLQLKETFGRIASKHREHYNKLISFLK